MAGEINFTKRKMVILNFPIYFILKEWLNAQTARVPGC